MMDLPTIQNAALLKSALEGLNSTPKSLESKWFYDNAGSHLFEEITELEEYYPTRTELAILTDNASLLEKYVPAASVLVELGSGASRKTRVLLDQFTQLAAYLPTDISGPFLNQVAQQLRHDYPRLIIDPIVADFTSPIPLHAKYVDTAKTAFFPGSTLGNLSRDDAISLLSRIRKWNNVTGFILGVDLVKDTQILLDAYNDAQGITADFNLNLLHRMNREIGAVFDVDKFEHEARWNDVASRIEMYLVSLSDQSVPIGSEEIRFSKGETIHTENSRKYTRESLSEMAALSGWGVSEFLTDADNLFAVAVLTPA
ncbi:L-histidine N(alpha)-methyltransferase [Falsihalocynthiibacter arcticus]|uniref:L-histidine N(alpha)-methyltransferase n=2 Tax=Falsihalocynthiibacter TaxID=2854182 RepID=UPI003002105A